MEAFAFEVVGRKHPADTTECTPHRTESALGRRWPPPESIVQMDLRAITHQQPNWITGWCRTLADPLAAITTPSISFFYQVLGKILFKLGRDKIEVQMMRVLIVEDDLEQAYLFRSLLSGIGAACEVARSVKEAMSVVIQQSFDLVVLDLFLPDGNTASLSDYLRMRFPYTAILSVTGSTALHNGEHTNILSSDYLLRKPIQREDFTAVAEYLLRTANPDFAQQME